MKLSMFVYGSSGIGKTHLLGTAKPPLTPMLIIDSDPGLMTLHGGPLSQFYSDAKSFIKIEDAVDESEIVGVAVNAWSEFQLIGDWLVKNPAVFRTVCWDSLTGLIEINRSHVVRMASSGDPEHDPDIPELRDYLRSQNQIVRAFRVFVSLPSHLIITAHSSAADKPVAGEEITPDLPDGLLRSLKLKIDAIGFFFWSYTDTHPDGVRRLSFKSSEAYLSRSRVRSLEDTYDQPDLLTVFASVL